MKAKAVGEARRPDGTAGPDAIYRRLFGSFNAKRDPRRKKNQTQIEAVVALIWAASQGDLNEVRALIAAGVEPGTADYDGRTPLHLAAAEGQLDVVRYLLAAGADPRPMDRWGGTPLSDAEGNGHTEIAALLRGQPEAVQPA